MSGGEADTHAEMWGNVPDELKVAPRWVCWQLEEREGKLTKVPYRADGGGKAGSTNPSTWATFDGAVAGYERHGFDGIGFVFADDRAFTGLDLDHVLDEDGRLADEYRWVVEDADTYAEISPSGDGLHLLFLGGKPEGATNCKRNQPDGRTVELYDHDRFFTMTGKIYADEGGIIHTTMREGGEVLRRVYDAFLADGKTKGKPKHEPKSKPTGGGAQSLTDDQVLELARAASNGIKFSRLWDGDTSEHAGDDSAADLALCDILAFYTQDRGQLDRLFRASGLMRPKWDEPRGGQSYGALTIEKALQGTAEVYSPRRRNEAASPAVKPWRKERGTFSHARLVDYLIEQRHARLCDGLLWVWDIDSQRYVGEVEAMRIIANLDRDATRNNRAETLSSLALRAPQVERGRDGLIACANGILDIRTGKLQDPDPSANVFASIDARWDPNTECTSVDRFLGDISEDADTFSSLLETVALCVWPSNPFQRAVVIVGRGGNGKSAFLSLLRRTLGASNCAALDLSSVGKRFQSTALIGRIANLVDDCGGGKLNDAELGVLKSAISHNEVACEFKGGRITSFSPQAQFVICGNAMPEFADVSRGMMRRLHFIELRHNFEAGGMPPEMAAELQTPAACSRLLALALTTVWGMVERGGLTQTKYGNIVAREVESQADPIKSWINERDEGVPKPGNVVAVAFDEFREWAETCGVTHDIGRDKFSRYFRVNYGLTTKPSRLSGHPSPVRVFTPV